ncbi:hypothetical protein [Wolbachia endosymbiont of Aedes albopictus]|uniref:hypothetical protein n=1 Tax=Wolbachia endosymbiont of Aedes albopictus TaxID=167957 RepID=UPI00216A33C2|nr:hypothetical protein [Wolbachia endosymbiont of Aedes albopictus]UVW84360.1 hypothetical protein NHG98_02550 [Wolbachia endosymbiont of Aedes albopictus]
MSFQRVTLESSLYYAATYLKLSFLDPSSQGTGMTPLGTAVIKEPVLATWMTGEGAT